MVTSIVGIAGGAGPRSGTCYWLCATRRHEFTV